MERKRVGNKSGEKCDTRSSKIVRKAKTANAEKDSWLCACHIVFGHDALLILFDRLCFCWLTNLSEYWTYPAASYCEFFCGFGRASSLET